MTENTTVKLDERTEEAMLELIAAGVKHGYIEKLSIADCGICQESLAALRERIRTLTEDAYAEGVSDGL